MNLQSLGRLAVLASACALVAGAACAEPDVSHVEAVNKTSALPAGWNKHAAFMEIFVRSYKDSDGDGIGDFKGLTSQLDYLQGLGITGIWLMPIMPSEDHDHGYAVDDYRAIEPDYGTMADFETFIAEAHKRGIGVILDFVCNHSGSGNAIFRDAAASKASPYRDWYVFSDRNPGWYDAKRRGQDGRFWNDPWKPVAKTVPDGQGYYYGVFSDQMPDWNLKNPRVVQYLQDTMRFWMNKGVDGFRLDAVTMLLEDGPRNYFNNPGNPVIVKQLKATVDEYDNRYMICEVSEGADKYLDACNAFAYGVQQSTIDGAKKGMIEDGLIQQLQNPRADQEPLALQSHDSYVGDRLIDQFGVNGTDSYRVAAAISILASATPFSYYGEEIGMSNGGAYNDPGLRSPMSWTGETHTGGFTVATPYRNLAINVASNNVAAEAGDPSSLLEYYRALYTVRQAYPVLGTGRLRLQSKAGDAVLVFSRGDVPGQAAFVAVNVSASPQPLDVFTGMPATSFVNALHENGQPVTAAGSSDGDGHLKLTIAPKSAMVLVRDGS